MRRSSRPRNSQLRDYKEEITVIVMMMKMEVTMVMKMKEIMEMKSSKTNLMNLTGNGF
jgi:hypothetical protein